jgi:hypothetical protein
MEFVHYAREFGVSNWLVSGYKGLVVRLELLDEKIGATLGHLVAFKLSILREERLKENSQASKYNKNPPKSTIEDQIQARFHDELEEIKGREKKYRTKQEIAGDEKLRQVEEKMRQEEEVLQQERMRTHIEEAQAKLLKDEEDLKARHEQLQLERAEVEKKKLKLEASNLTPVPGKTAVTSSPPGFKKSVR